jgi:hypothetical protein
MTAYFDSNSGFVTLTGSGAENRGNVVIGTKVPDPQPDLNQPGIVLWSVIDNNFPGVLIDSQLRIRGVMWY